MDEVKYWEERHAQAGRNIPGLHRFITEFTSDLDLSPSKRVFLPLCGRCLELKWFYEKGLEVVGVDIVEAPIKQFFEEHSLDFVEKDLSWAKLYETKDGRLKIYVCSIYDMDINEVGKFDVIWDKGSLAVIDEADRDKYTQLMKTLLKEEFLYLLVSMQFDDKNTTAPCPKNISDSEISRLFSEWCSIKTVFTRDFPGAQRLANSLKTDKIEEIFILLTAK